MKLSREMQKVRHCCRTFIFPSLPDLPVFMQVKLKVSASAVNYLNSQVGATIGQPVQACELRSIRHLLGRAAGKPHPHAPKKIAPGGAIVQQGGSAVLIKLNRPTSSHWHMKMNFVLSICRSPRFFADLE